MVPETFLLLYTPPPRRDHTLVSFLTSSKRKSRSIWNIVNIPYPPRRDHTLVSFLTLSKKKSRGTLNIDSIIYPTPLARSFSRELPHIVKEKILWHLVHWFNIPYPPWRDHILVCFLTLSKRKSRVTWDIDIISPTHPWQDHALSNSFFKHSLICPIKVVIYRPPPPPPGGTHDHITWRSIVPL